MVLLLFKWLKGYVGPLGSETTALGNGCITLFRSCSWLIVVSVFASHFVEIQSIAFSISKIILKRCFLRYGIVFDIVSAQLATSRRNGKSHMKFTPEAGRYDTCVMFSNNTSHPRKNVKNTRNRHTNRPAESVT